MTFAQLSLICLVALLGPVLFVQRALRLPVVVGELAVGLALGASGLRLLTATDPTFAFLADIGFALVMLVAGSHVPVRAAGLRSGLAAGCARAVAVGVVAVPVGHGLAAAFGTGHGPLYAVLIASSSASLVMPALGSAPLDSPAVVQMIAQVAVADTACIVALPFVIDPGHVGRAAVGAVVVAAAAGVMYLGLSWAERSGHRRRVHAVSEERALAIELRVSLALLFGLAALATSLRVSTMLAGFAMGLVLAAVGEPRRLAKQLFALTEGFFAPIFFVWLGAGLDLSDLGRHPSAVALGVALGVGAVAVHAAPALARQPLPLAALTSAQLGVPVAAAALGSRAGLLGPGEDTAVLLGAIVTIVVVAAASGPVIRLASDAAYR